MITSAAVHILNRIGHKNLCFFNFFILALVQHFSIEGRRDFLDMVVDFIHVAVNGWPSQKLRPALFYRSISFGSNGVSKITVPLCGDMYALRRAPELKANNSPTLW